MPILTIPQLVIELSQNGFTQVLAQTANSSNWSFPVIYTPVPSSQPAEVATISIGAGTPTTLTSGPTSQPISGSGSAVNLNVELGPNCEGVKINSNPNNLSGCSYPLVSLFTADDAPDVFQIFCNSQPVTLSLGATVEIQSDPDPEIPPTSADVGVSVDGKAAEPVAQGTTNFTFTTLAFNIANFTGDGKVLIFYAIGPPIE